MKYFTVYSIFKEMVREREERGRGEKERERERVQASKVHSVGVFMLISRAKVRPGAAGSDYSECSDWLLQIAALIRYASDVKSRERQMYLAVLAGTVVKHAQHVRRLTL